MPPEAAKSFVEMSWLETVVSVVSVRAPSVGPPTGTPCKPNTPVDQRA